MNFDISQTEKIEEFIENASKELGGNLDCLINNAGITKDNLSIRMSVRGVEKSNRYKFNFNIFIK